MHLYHLIWLKWISEDWRIVIPWLLETSDLWFNEIQAVWELIPIIISVSWGVRLFVEGGNGGETAVGAMRWMVAWSFVMVLVAFEELE